MVYFLQEYVLMSPDFWDICLHYIYMGQMISYSKFIFYFFIYLLKRRPPIGGVRCKYRGRWHQGAKDHFDNRPAAWRWLQRRTKTLKNCIWHILALRWVAEMSNNQTDATMKGDHCPMWSFMCSEQLRWKWKQIGSLKQVYGLVINGTGRSCSAGISNGPW